MFVAIRLGGVDAGRLNGDVNASVLGTLRIEFDGAGEIGKAAAYFAQKVTHLEGDFRMAAIDVERLNGDGGVSGHDSLLWWAGFEPAS
jgi:hypothetical protein